MTQPKSSSYLWGEQRTMKNKTVLILLIALPLLLFLANYSGATDGAGSVNIEEQIKVLLDKIAHLKQLIASLMLQNEVLAESYLVVNMEDGSVILEKNINQPHSIASITKLMNAVVATENLDKSQSIILTSDMLKPYGYSPSLFLGLSVTMENLLKASLIQSTNDASESISYFTGHEKFLELMNQKAKELDMDNTQYYDAHGMDPRNHSTASDLIKLVEYINEEHPDIWNITKDNDFWLPDPTGKMLHFKNLNVFYNDPEFIGGKTGYLKEAKESLASIFELNGKKFNIVVLKSQDRKADALKIIDFIKANNVSMSGSMAYK